MVTIIDDNYEESETEGNIVTYEEINGKRVAVKRFAKESIKYANKDKGGKWAKTNNPKNKTMRVTQEEKEIILARRMQEGETHIKALITNGDDESTKESVCHFCRKTDHEQYLQVGWKCLEDVFKMTDDEKVDAQMSEFQETSDNFECSYCDWTFTTNGEKNNHERETHGV